MEVQFIGSDAREKARPLLDEVLEGGVDQVAIACAFLTDGGAAFLKQHVSRLRLPDSFLVVAWHEFNDLKVVEELHTQCPGRIYLHLGVETPEEKKVGPGLMHSKVFFARSGERCWLWTGSHNLTASALQGVNAEAAVVLKGTIDETPFRDALAHLTKCRDEAVLFDPFDLPERPHPDQTLVIHAERHTETKSIPWFVHLRPATTKYDSAMRPPASVWLYLYPPNSLHPGSPRPLADAAYSGTITALNFTESHRKTPGIPADWGAGADYVIEQHGKVFRLTSPGLHRRTETQGVFRILQEEDPKTLWLAESPMPKLKGIIGQERLTEVDPEYQRFFTAPSLREGRLVHREYKELGVVRTLSRRDIGSVDPDKVEILLQAKEGSGREPDVETQIGNPARPRRLKVSEVVVEDKESADRSFDFIYRAKFRV